MQAAARWAAAAATAAMAAAGSEAAAVTAAAGAVVVAAGAAAVVTAADDPGSAGPKRTGRAAGCAAAATGSAAAAAAMAPAPAASARRRHFRLERVKVALVRSQPLQHDGPLSHCEPPGCDHSEATTSSPDLIDFSMLPTSPNGTPRPSGLPARWLSKATTSRPDWRARCAARRGGDATSNGCAVSIVAPPPYAPAKKPDAAAPSLA